MARPPAADYVKRLWVKYKDDLRSLVNDVAYILVRRIPGLNVIPEGFGEYDGIVYEKAWEGFASFRGRSVAQVFVAIVPRNRRAKFVIMAETLPKEDSEGEHQDTDIMARIDSFAFAPGTSKGVVWDAFQEIAHPEALERFGIEFERSLRELTSGPKEWWPEKPS